MSRMTGLNGLGQCGRVFGMACMASVWVSLLLGGRLAVGEEPPWYMNPMTNFTYSQGITLSGAVTAETLTNFPFLLVITNQDNPVFSHAKANGDDLVFTKGDGRTVLAHELDEFVTTGSAKRLVAWVKIPVLRPGGMTQLVLQYGNATAPNQQNAAGVWADGYRAVWHLKGTNTAGLYPDSTPNAFNGTNYVTGDTEFYGGKIGKGVSFDGVNDYITEGAFTSNAFTLCAWVLTATTNKFTIISDNSQTYFARTDTNQLLGRSWHTNAGSVASTVSGTNAGLSTIMWTWCCFRSTGLAGQGRDIFIDGAKSTKTADQPLSPPLKADPWTRIGHCLYFPYLNGALDEIQIQSVARSDGWLLACYKNQNDPGAYITVESEQSIASQWDCRQAITFYAGMSGSSTLTNFPALIHVTNQANEVFSLADSSGRDILFTGSNGTTLLSYEIERFTNSGSSKELAAWVNIPVLPHNQDTTLYMYYGANNAPSAEDPTAVWSNGFSAVWHLNESTVNGGATYDSTLNGYLGARMDTNGYGGGDAVGKIAGGDWFSSNINHGVRTAGVPVSSNGFTVSAWVYRSGGDVPRVFENGLMPGAYSGIFDLNRCYFSIKPEGALPYVPAAVVIPDYVAGAWYYLTGVATPTQSYVYVNGNYLGASAVYTNADQIRAKWIGVYANNQSVNWFGGVDELRVENTIRSADWIKACYNNQMDSGAYVTISKPRTRFIRGTLVLVQ